MFIGDLVLGRKGDVRIGRREISDNGRRTRRQEGRNEKDGEGSDGVLTWKLIMNQFHRLTNSSLEEASLRRVIALTRRINSLRRSMKSAIVEVYVGRTSGGRLACLLLRRLFILSAFSVSFWRSKKESKAAHSSRSAASIQSSCSGPYGAAHLTSY